nr:integrase, catalytic region, zinc finger, CCHC-type, peptidase aspartic, catalytic [Tanacetum cinerariifolium]
MKEGGKDRQPMLAPDNYIQWKTKIKRYINTKPNNELIHYCLQNLHYKFKLIEKTVLVAEGSSKTIIDGYMENYKNVSQDTRNQFDAETKELEAHYMYMAQIQEVTPDDTDNSRPIFDTNPLQKLIKIILFIIDSRCSKHMTGNLKLLSNFVEKFLGTMKFGNDQITLILGYGDLVKGNITIKRVYYLEGLNHNLFSTGRFCNVDLEVAF